jgi:hypothetical protein
MRDSLAVLAARARDDAAAGRDRCGAIASVGLASTKERDERHSAANVKAGLDELEEAIEHLKVSYEKYFVGVDRQAPSREHAKVERMLRQLEALRPHGTALRFRLQGLRARLVTYRHYWHRVLDQMEKGTYRRDLQRMARKTTPPREDQFAARGEGRPEPEPDLTQTIEDPSGEHEMPTSEPSASPTPTRHRGRRQPPADRKSPAELPAGVSAHEARALFKELVAKKRAAGENTDGLSYAGLVRRLSKEAPKLQARFGDKYRFEIATDGGRVRLRATRD